MIYHWPGCPDYEKIAIHDRVPFQDRQEAEEPVAGRQGIVIEN
jgi:hypothetical protein